MQGNEWLPAVTKYRQEAGEGFCRNAKVTVTDSSGEREIISMNIAWQGAEAYE